MQDLKYLEQFDYKTLTFWIHVFNKGRTTAKDCHTELMFKDILGNVVTVATNEPRLGEFFSIPWMQGQTTNIIPRKDNSFTKIKLPFKVDIATNPNDCFPPKVLPVSRTMYEPPIARWELLPVSQIERGYLMEVEAILRITYEGGQTPASRFLIRIPIGKPIIDPTAVQFESYT